MSDEEAKTSRLVSTILAEEQRRTQAQQETDEVVIPDDRLFGKIGESPVKLSEGLARGGGWKLLVLLFLLVFILQNGDPVQISFFALEGVLPTGVALLLAAIAGILLVAIPGSVRILQLRRAARRQGRPER